MTEDITGKVQAELADVLSKVNSWSLSREKELQTLKVDHTNFLDSHNGTNFLAALTPETLDPFKQRAALATMCEN
eukprot:3166219-Rhodomonas_salina.2